LFHKNKTERKEEGYKQRVQLDRGDEGLVGRGGFLKNALYGGRRGKKDLKAKWELHLWEAIAPFDR
jgi:hypothetical protein